MSETQLQAAKEKIARMRASALRQLASIIRRTAKDAAQSMYAPRVLSKDFDEAFAALEKAVWRVSDIVVPRTKEGFADAKKLIEAAFAHAFRPMPEGTEKAKEKKIPKKTQASKSKK